jgi:beta-barrel assembly-enhancing protease
VITRPHYILTSGIIILVISLCFGNPANARGLISTSMEIQIGRQTRDNVFKEYKKSDDAKDNKLVTTLGKAVVPFAPQRKGINYEFYVLDSKEINAFAAPGGFIFITSAMLDFAKRDPNRVAGVLAHEVAHVARKHANRAMENSLAGSLGIFFLGRALGFQGQWEEAALGVALNIIQNGYSREDEYEADRYSVLMTYHAGWDPKIGMILMLSDLEKLTGKGNKLGDIGRCFSSHPDTDRRVFFANNYYTKLSATEPFHAKPFPEGVKVPK